MNRRIRTLLLAAPLLALASCQIVSGLSGVDLDGTGSGGASGPCTDQPSEAAAKCSTLFLDADVVNDGSSCTFVAGEVCKAKCRGATGPAVGLDLLSSAKCSQMPAPSCVTKCEATCACKDSKTDCFAACDETCLAGCTGPHCKDLCGGGCAAACASDSSSCHAACDGACRIEARASCGSESFAAAQQALELSCKNTCVALTPFCDGTWMIQDAGNQNVCKSWLRSQGVTVH